MNVAGVAFALGLDSVPEAHDLRMPEHGRYGVEVLWGHLPEEQAGRLDDHPARRSSWDRRPLVAAEEGTYAAPAALPGGEVFGDHGAF